MKTSLTVAAVAIATSLAIGPALAEDAPMKSERAMPAGSADESAKKPSERAMPEQAKPGTAPNGTSERAMPPGK